MCSLSDYAPPLGLRGRSCIRTGGRAGGMLFRKRHRESLLVCVEDSFEA